MRRPLIAANWKMNTTLADAHVLANGVRNHAEHMDRVDIVLCPPSLWLTELVHGGIAPRQMPHLKLGAQNMHDQESGAFTGEISPLMVKEVAEYVIIGHSERTHLFNEDWDFIASKLKAAFAHNLIPILCVGEDEQNADSKKNVLHILKYLTQGLTEAQLEKLVVAYEPVWAISDGAKGTAATPEYAQDMVSHLRGHLTPKTRILYGGSSNDKNARSFLEQADIDGFLVGGASLKLKAFVTMCQIADDMAATRK